MHPDQTSYISDFRRLLEEHFEPTGGDFGTCTLKGTPERYDVHAGVEIEVSAIFQLTLWMRVDTPEREATVEAHRNLVLMDAEDNGGDAYWAWENFGEPFAAIETEIEKLDT